MKDIDYTQLQARAVQIRDECGKFMETCRINTQKAKTLCDETARLRDEAMILKEECIADKSKALAILLLILRHKALNDERFIQISSIGDDTSILLQMIEEVRLDAISEQSPLANLRDDLLGLSFLPSPS